MKCIDEEILFEVPKGWEWTRLGNIFNHTSGKQQSSSNKCGGTPQKFITTSNLYWGYFVLDTVKVMNFTEEEIKSCSATKGDLLVCEGGAGYGRSAIWNEDYDICLQNHIHRLRPLVEGTCEYVYYFIYLQKESNSLASIGTAMPGLSANRLKSLLIPLPPLAEQNRITNKLKDVFPEVEKYDKAQERHNLLNSSLNDVIRKSILQEAIQGKLVYQDPSDEPASILLQRIRDEKQRLVKEGKLKQKDVIDSTIFRGDDNKYYERIGAEIYDINDTIPFDIPANWNWCRLKDVCSIFTGATFKKEDASTGSKGVRVLRGGNISPFELVMKPDDLFLPYTKIKESILLRKNDIVTPAVTSLENIGKAARVQKDLNDVTVGGFVFILRSFLCNDLLSQYLLALLGSPSMGEYMKSVTNKSGQAFYNIGKERLAMAMIPLPPLLEQQRIVAQIEKLFEQLK
ncbi:MAG: restriction endonuclease subunit S [Prevotella sp.]|nr:restriction endonuclease subunit S [Prevotella sp.]